MRLIKSNNYLFFKIFALETNNILHVIVRLGREYNKEKKTLRENFLAQIDMDILHTIKNGLGLIYSNSKLDKHIYTW